MAGDRAIHGIKSAQGLRQAVEAAQRCERWKLIVTGEELIAAIAAQRHLHMPRGELAKR